MEPLNLRQFFFQTVYGEEKRKRAASKRSDARACERSHAILRILRGKGGSSRTRSTLWADLNAIGVYWEAAAIQDRRAQRRCLGEEREEERAGVHLLFRVLLPCVNIGHTTECTAEGDPDDPSGTRRQPVSMKRTSARKERGGSEGRWMRGRNESWSRSKWRKKRRARQRGREEEREDGERTRRERDKESEKEGDAKETYVPTRTPQDASCHGRASGPPMPRSW